MGRDKMSGVSCELQIPFQSTRPHGARQGFFTNVIHGYVVSIHAPAWGATFLQFNNLIIKHVSIHAPAWGATFMGQQIVLGIFQFQSTRPHGARPINAWSKKWYDKFQSTRPHGARPPVSSHGCSVIQFQSTRPHGARRTDSLKSCFSSVVSIHAPAWGATYTTGIN